jgi:dihydrofolate reductase
MRKVVAAINMTLDGFCDHTAGVPDAQLHDHYADLIRDADAILYGRITYELMQFWRPLAANPSGEKSMDDFAVVMNNIPKIVFSNTLKSTDWDTATLATQPIEEVLAALKQQPGRDILIGSRSLIIQLMNRNLIDEYQFCVHPVVIGKGLPLFDRVNDHTLLKLLKTKSFESGAIILYYKHA